MQEAHARRAIVTFFFLLPLCRLLLLPACAKEAKALENTRGTSAFCFCFAPRLIIGSKQMTGNGR